MNSKISIKQIMGIDDIKDAKRYELTDEDWAGIDQLVAEKYDNWEWNYGRSPRYEYNRNERFSCTIDISLSIEHNHCRLSYLWRFLWSR